jgi:hypothetical protein
MITWLPHLHFYEYPSTRSLAGAVIDPSNDKSTQEEVDLLKRTVEAASAKKEKLAHASAVFIEHTISDISDRPSSRGFVESLYRPPQGQLRVWGPESHTKYVKKLGFLCSSWRTCRPVSSLEELKQRGSSTVTSLRSHCENQRSPSDWISLSGDASWMLKNVNRKWPTDSVSAGNMRVALVSTAKMERLKLLFDRSDLLVLGAGGSKTGPNRVKFAWPGHYLVYGWIPVQCIVKVFNLAQFRDICKEHNIRPGQKLLGQSFLHFTKEYR